MALLSQPIDEKEFALFLEELNQATDTEIKKRTGRVRTDSIHYYPIVMGFSA